MSNVPHHRQTSWHHELHRWRNIAAASCFLKAIYVGGCFIRALRHSMVSLSCLPAHFEGWDAAL